MITYFGPGLTQIDPLLTRGLRYARRYRCQWPWPL